MITAGVDLAAQPAGTALCLIDWGASGADVGAGATDSGAGAGATNSATGSSGPDASGVQDASSPASARLISLVLGVTDEPIVDAATTVDKLGIDCAFGWPDAFVAFVAGHAAGRPLDGGGDPDPDSGAGDDGPIGGMNWRRSLAYRETDRRVRQTTGRWPLSVSTDRLGLTAMRCAALLSRIEASGRAVDRSGSGLSVEIYPGASLRLWGFDTKNYRVDALRRGDLVDELVARVPWLDFGVHEALMRASTDAFDAVIACLATRAAALGHTTAPEPRVLAQARREGWVALPTCGLDALR